MDSLKTSSSLNFPQPAGISGGESNKNYAKNVFDLSARRCPPAPSNESNPQKTIKRADGAHKNERQIHKKINEEFQNVHQNKNKLNDFRLRTHNNEFCEFPGYRRVVEENVRQLDPGVPGTNSSKAQGGHGTASQFGPSDTGHPSRRSSGITKSSTASVARGAFRIEGASAVSCSDL